MLSCKAQDYEEYLKYLLPRVNSEDADSITLVLSRVSAPLNLTRAML